MLYCSDCQRLTEGDCPHCGKRTKKLREAQATDPVLFFSSDFVHAAMVEPLLADNAIPYSKMGQLGAALAMRSGSFLEKFSFYVPYGAFESAVQLVAGTFGADASIMRDLNTLGVDLDVQADDAGNIDGARVAAQYAKPDRHDVRRALHDRFTIAEIPYADWLLDRMALAPSLRILDVGCGSGDIWTRRALPDDLFITMADASEGMIDAARTRTKDISNARFEFIVADACALPFEDDQYDLVLASHMLFHVSDLYAALGEIARVLKPGGRLCATTMSKENLREMYELAERHGIILPRPSNGFDLENGAHQLEPFFARVKRADYESSLQVTETEPLVQYIQSTDTFGMQTEEGIAAMREEIAQRIARDGSYDISKRSCAFLCDQKNTKEPV